jgi:hypothetical protein
VNLASVAVRIGCVGPLGEKQGFWSYPRGPSQHSLSLNCTPKYPIFVICMSNDFDYPCRALYVLYCAVVEKINDISRSVAACELYKE